jgi:hypothetical protein
LIRTLASVPAGRTLTIWEPESDWGRREQAAERVHWASNARRTGAQKFLAIFPYDGGELGDLKGAATNALASALFNYWIHKC